MGAELSIENVKEIPKTREQIRDQLLKDVHAIAEKTEYPLPEGLDAAVKKTGTVEQQIRFLKDLKDQIELTNYVLRFPNKFPDIKFVKEFTKMQPSEAAPKLRLLTEREGYIDDLNNKAAFGEIGKVIINEKTLPWNDETVNLLRLLPPQQAIINLEEIKLTIKINNAAEKDPPKVINKKLTIEQIPIRNNKKDLE